MSVLTELEEGREVVVRQVPCPVCGAQPHRPCWYGRGKVGQVITQVCSHTGRYLAAAACGVVPRLVGQRRLPWTS